jgi:hypothetical protein
MVSGVNSMSDRSGTNARKSTSKTAIRRCCKAWQNTFDAFMAEPGPGRRSEAVAASWAGLAYCKAMPLLDGTSGIRDFIACVAHGILIGAIPEKRSGKLLYAAQVALATVAARNHRPAAPPPTPSRSNRALSALKNTLQHQPIETLTNKSHSNHSVQNRCI